MRINVGGTLCEPSLTHANLSALQMSIAHIMKCYTNVLFTLLSINIYGAIIMTKAIVRVYPVHLMNADRALGVCQPSDQANQLGL